MTLPDGIRGRLTALGILLLFLTLVFHWVLLPLGTGYLAHSDDLDQLRQAVASSQRVTRRLSPLQQTADTFDRRDPIQAYVWAGDTPALASTQIQQLLRNTASATGLRVLTLHSQTPVDDNTLQRIPVSGRFLGDTKALLSLLTRLERHTPYLFVNAIDIRPSSSRRAGGGTDELDVRLTVYGLRAETPTQGGSNG